MATSELGRKRRVAVAFLGALMAVLVVGLVRHKRFAGEYVPPSGVMDSVHDAHLRAWLRDSAVIDSIARLVPTDTFVMLYTGMVSAKRPHLVWRELACYEDRVTRRYGGGARAAVSERIRDSVWSAAGRGAVREMERRIPSGIYIGTEHCPRYDGPKAPRMIGETDIWAPLPGRPWVPRRLRK